MSSSKAQQDEWSGKIGVILAVAGSAVGLGNFLRFPGLAAQYGGGAFMVAYGLMLVLVGVPVAWAEWSIGRRGGQMGAHCAPGVFWYLTKGSRLWKFLGVLAVLGPSSVAFYYMVVEAWCCGYFWKMLTCPEVFATAEGTAQTFFSFTGMYGDGSALLSDNGLLWIVSGVILLNLGIIYRGISRGIEMFSRWFMPLLLLISLVLLVRILCIGTPDPSYPDRSIEQGLGYMWNPGKVLVEGMDTSGLQKGATYPEIKARVLEQTGLKVSSLYISQVKQKCGLEVRENHHKAKSENTKQPQCPKEKEDAIVEALKHFQMI